MAIVHLTLDGDLYADHIVRAITCRQCWEFKATPRRYFSPLPPYSAKTLCSLECRDAWETAQILKHGWFGATVVADVVFCKTCEKPKPGKPLYPPFKTLYAQMPFARDNDVFCSRACLTADYLKWLNRRTTHLTRSD